MKTLLAIDIGNTNMTAGVFKGRRLARKAKIPTREHSSYTRRLKRLLGGDRAKAVIISSVVPRALARLRGAIRGIAPGKVLVVGRNVKAPIRNLYRRKDEVGQDRLVNAFAAKALYGAPAVVVDFGTAITFDCVSGKGAYLGGLILPGIETSFTALYEKTALLPRVKLADRGRLNTIIGKDTADSMRGGILFGFGAMCDGLIGRYKKILGEKAKVIATGGNARLMKVYARSIQAVDDDLTLKGLFLIHETIAKKE